MVLRVAVPNKGALSEPAREMLVEAGYLRSASTRELMVHDPDNDVDFFFLRPKDIAVYVGAGKLDLGITGKDMLLDSGVEATPVLELGFAPSTFRFAAVGGASLGVSDLNGMRIATSYAGLLQSWLTQHDVRAQVVRLDGAVENSIALGVADAIADVVATGTTLKKAGLEILGEPLLVSQALLIRRPEAPASPAIETFIRRMNGVMVARAYVLVDYDIPTGDLDRACAITPGIESPTVSSLHDPAWSAVRAMVPSKDVHRVMDELYDMGARGILVTDIHACRL